MNGLLGGMQGAQGCSLSQFQGSLGGASGQQNVYSTQASAPPPRTLSSALSSLDELNKRLSSTASSAYALASLVGGPFPTGGEKADADQPPQSAMERLNEAVQVAHWRLAEIDNAVASMSRSLGAN